MYRKLFRVTLFNYLAVLLFPIAILAPFASMTGFFTIEELIVLLTNPPTLGIQFFNLILGTTLAYLLVRRFSKSVSAGNTDWKTLRRFGLTFLGVFAGLILYVTTAAEFILLSVIRHSFPSTGSITALLMLGFVLMVNLPLFLLVVRQQDLLFRRLSTDPEKFASIAMKLVVVVGGVILGIVLVFIALDDIIGHVHELNRHLPVSELTLFIIVGVTAYFFVIMSLIILVRNIVRPMDSMIRAFEKGANGDFREIIEVTTSDEVGILSVQSNQLYNSLNQGFSTVGKSVEGLQSSKNDLSAKVEEMAGAVEEIRRNLTATNNQMDDHSSNIIETTAAVEQLARNIDSLGRNIAHQVDIIGASGRSVSELVEGNEQLLEMAVQSKEKTAALTDVSRESEAKLKAMADRVASIMESSRHLMEANDLIANVASRTNLLAMNAAIEAAHAGDAGRGFAVVADEIRKLAETSSEQSSAINQNLKEVVDDIEKVGAESQSVQTSFTQINSHVSEVGDTVIHMSDFSENVRNFGMQLEESLGSIKTVSDTVSLGSREMELGNEEILKAITNMREISQKVGEAVTEISIGADEITGLAAGMLDQNKATDAALGDVRNVLSGFKVRDED